jgi:tetratricopeptide (TPR) repeat protein
VKVKIIERRFAIPILFCTFGATKDITVMTRLNYLFTAQATKVLILIVGLIYCFSSCRSERENTPLLPELVQAEEVMYTRPDSAYHILTGMTAVRGKGELQYATWALLMTQAKYKLYIHQNDSLVNVALDYFMHYGNSQRKSMALYYKAVLYDEKKDIENAQRYLLQATDYLNGSNSDYQISYLIYSKLCEIYLYRDMTEYVDSLNNKALDCALMSRNYNYITDAYKSKARVYLKKKDFQKSIEYYLKAIETADSNQLYKAESSIYLEMAACYDDMGNKELFLKSIDKGFQLREDHSIALTPLFYFAKGDAYYSIKNDSAIFYLTKSLEGSDIYTKYNTYIRLYEYSQQRGNYKEALKFCKNSILCRDSIHKIDKRNVLTEMQQKYDFQKLENEKNILLRKHVVAIHRLLLLIVVISLLVAIVVIFFQRKLHRKEHRIIEAEEKVRTMFLEIQSNQSTIKNNQEQIKVLEDSISLRENDNSPSESQKELLSDLENQNVFLKNQNERLRKEIEQYSSSLHERIDELTCLNNQSITIERLQARIVYMERSYLANDEFIVKLKHSLKGVNSPAEWKAIYDAVNVISEDFVYRLSTRCPSLTENDIKLCCLIKLRFTNKQIANIMSLSVLSIPKYKQRIKEHIMRHEKLEDNKTLDTWISEQ